MVTVTGMTAERMLAIEGASVTSGAVNSGTGHLILTTHDGTDIDAGNVYGTVADSSTTVKGIVELATSGETTTGTDTVRAVTPAGLAAVTVGLQPIDSDLTAIAAISPANDDIIQRKSGAWTNRTLTQLAADLTSSLMQPKDADLTTIAGLSPAANDVMQYKSGAWANRTMSQLATDLSSLLQPIDSDLTAIAAISPSNDDVIQRKAGAWTNRTIAQLKTDLAITSGSGATWWSRVRSGIWYPLTGYGTTGGTSAVSLSSGNEHAMPMTFGFSATITGIAVSKTTGSGNMRLGIRNDVGDMSPGTVAYDSGALGTSTGVIAVTGLTGVTVSPGVPIWFTVVSQSAASSITGQSIIHPYLGSVSSTTPTATDFSTNQPGAYYQTGVTGALGSTFTIAGINPGSLVIKIQFGGTITQGP